MAQGHLFLYGEDSLDDVRAIRDKVMAALPRGVTAEWTSENVSVKKVVNSAMALEAILSECNYFLRLYDPQIRALNPVVKRTKVNMIYPF